MSTFLHVVELLLTNDNAKAEYATDPASFLDSHGLGSFDSVDVADAMGHAADALPMSVARQLDPDHGLDSAAELDLGAHGLSLDRQLLDEDIEDGELDPYGADADVDFDAPDVHGDDGAEVVDALDAADIDDDAASDTTDADADLERLGEENTTPEPETSPDVEASPEVETAPAVEAAADIDTADYLTDITFDAADLDTALETEPLDESGIAFDQDSLDDLDAESPDDLPDDFDLLD